jgi:hypothetical protein
MGEDASANAIASLEYDDADVLVAECAGGGQAGGSSTDDGDISVQVISAQFISAQF